MFDLLKSERAPKFISFVFNLIDRFMGRKFFTFALIGTCTAVIYFSMFSLCYEWMHLDYRLGVAIAYPSALIFNFTMNRNVTFKNNNDPLPQLIRYMSMVVLNYLITIAIVIFSVKILKLSPYVGSLNAIAVTTFSGFVILNTWVFKKNK